MKFGIKKPCTADYSEMDKTKNGRFCQLCSKEVVNFSAMSTAEIVQHLSATTKERICGKFKAGQLDFVGQEFPNSSLGSHGVNWQKYLLAASVLVITSCGTVSVNEEQDIMTYNENDFPHLKSCTERQDSLITANPPIEKKNEERFPPPMLGELAVVGNLTFPPEPPVHDGPYAIVDEQAQFPGGQEALLKYIYTNVDFSGLREAHSVFGLVVVRFVVDENGKVNDPKIVRSISEAAGEKVLRLVREMPDWKPGTLNGITVSSYYNLPVRFEP
ncbi:energy transducer TonB [Chitinophagales bacterium]|nr:energy transducer TonB [Chitinophagales bacterium]